MDDYQSEDPLYVTILIYLFLTELAVGAIQLIGALIRTLILLSKNKPLGKLKRYWMMVLIYCIIFVALYFTQQYIINNIWFRDINHYNSENYLVQIKVYSYFMYAYIIWIALAWLIAIWYSIHIVFNKESYTLSTSREAVNVISENEDSIDSTTH